jgi:ethanolamine phosphate transferase 2 subunit G
MTQSRTTNVPLFPILRVQKLILASIHLNGIEVTVTSFLLQYMTFFAFGGSNSISSIDLSSAYNGVGSYDIFLVGVLTFLSNWAGPIWWVSATHMLRARRNREDREMHLVISTLHMTASLLSVMAACTVLRTHLFIWTVFSPKFLYGMTWAMGNHLLLNVLMDGMLSHI